MKISSGTGGRGLQWICSGSACCFFFLSPEKEAKRAKGGVQHGTAGWPPPLESPRSPATERGQGREPHGRLAGARRHGLGFSFVGARMSRASGTPHAQANKKHLPTAHRQKMYVVWQQERHARVAAHLSCAVTPTRRLKAMPAQSAFSGRAREGAFVLQKPPSRKSHHYFSAAMRSTAFLVRSRVLKAVRRK